MTDKLNKFSRISENFYKFSTDADYIYELIKSVPTDNLKETLKDYRIKEKKSKIKKVISARARLAEYLIKHKHLDNEIVEEIKNQIREEARRNNYKKNIFHSWNPNWRILYPLYYNQHRKDVINFFNILTSKIRKDLDITSITDVTIDDFNGPQHFGTPLCWFAIYNKSHRTQKTAYQLFFSIERKQIKHGLFKYNENDETELKKINVSDFKYDDLLKNFRKYRNKIISDNTNIKNSNSRRTRRGKTTVNIEDYFRKKVNETVVRQEHKKIQQFYFEMLQSIYKKPDYEVLLEKDYIDISVEGKHSINLYEIKTDKKAIFCIRNAIGQLLLYACRKQSETRKKINLIVVGPSEDNVGSKEFREYLDKYFGFSFEYSPVAI